MTSTLLIIRFFLSVSVIFCAALRLLRTYRCFCIAGIFMEMSLRIEPHLRKIQATFPFLLVWNCARSETQIPNAEFIEPNLDYLTDSFKYHPFRIYSHTHTLQIRKSLSNQQMKHNNSLRLFALLMLCSAYLLAQYRLNKWNRWNHHVINVVVFFSNAEERQKVREMVRKNVWKSLDRTQTKSINHKINETNDAHHSAHVPFYNLSRR